MDKNAITYKINNLLSNIADHLIPALLENKSFQRFYLQEHDQIRLSMRKFVDDGGLVLIYLLPKRSS